jgi:hypothetical protein
MERNTGRGAFLDYYHDVGVVGLGDIKTTLKNCFVRRLGAKQLNRQNV